MGGEEGIALMACVGIDWICGLEIGAIGATGLDDIDAGPEEMEC